MGLNRIPGRWVSADRPLKSQLGMPMVRFNHSTAKAKLNMKTSKKLLIYLILFALIDTVIPVPITALILIYVLLEKPAWFENLVEQIYHPK
jgi:hypothetical protein